MSKRHLLLGSVVLVQAILSYLAWPNPWLASPNPLSSLLMPLVIAPMFFWPLVLKGGERFIWTGLSGIAVFVIPQIYFLRLALFPIQAVLIFLFIILLVIVLTGSVGILFGSMQSRLAWSPLLFFPATLTAITWLRGSLSYYVFFIPRSTVLAYPLAGVPPLIQIASIVGEYGTEFMVAFAATVLAVAAKEGLLRVAFLKNALNLEGQTPLSAPDRKKAVVTGLVVAGVLLLLLVAGNLEAIKVGQAQKTTARTIKIALLQSNLDSTRDYEYPTQYNSLHFYRAMCLEAHQAGAELALFGEGDLPARFPRDKPYWDQFRTILVEAKLAAIFGLTTSVDQKHHYNAWYLAGPDGLIKDYYLKQYLTPFGEYMPMRRLANFLMRRVNFFLGKHYSLLKLTAINTWDYDLTAGQVNKIFNWNGKKIALHVCDEMLHPRFFRDSVGQGAEVLLSPTVGFWFRTPEYFNTTNLIACFRAVETRRWVGRVASLSTSAYIDALGCVRSPQPFNTRVVNVMTVPLLSGQTFYTKFGDVFSWLCALVSAALIALAWLGARVRNPSERKPPAKG